MNRRRMQSAVPVRSKKVRIYFPTPSTDKLLREKENKRRLVLSKLLLKRIEKYLDTNRMYRNGKVFVKHQGNYELVVFLIFSDALRLYHSMLLLLSSNQVASAAILNRMLLERLVDVLFISKSSRARAKRYLDYWQMNRFRLLVKINEQLGFPRPDDKTRNQQLEEAKTFVAKHSGRFKGEHWSGKQIRERCAVTGLSRQYALLFYEYSSYGHSDPVASLANVNIHAGGVVATYKGERGKETYLFHLVTTEMVKYMTLLLAVLAGTFKMSLDESLVGAFNKLRENADFIYCFRKSKVLWRDSGA